MLKGNSVDEADGAGGSKGIAKDSEQAKKDVKEPLLIQPQLTKFLSEFDDILNRNEATSRLVTNIEIQKADLDKIKNKKVKMEQMHYDYFKQSYFTNETKQFDTNADLSFKAGLMTTFDEPTFTKYL